MSTLGHYVLALAVTGVVMTALGLFAYLEDRSRWINRTLGWYYLAVGWWAGFEAIAIAVHSDAVALACWRINQIGVILIPVLFLHFVVSFAETPSRTWRWLVRAGYAQAAVFLALDATPLYAERAVPKFEFRHFIEPGP